MNSDKTHSLVRFIGFGGLVACVGFAVALGRYQANIEHGFTEEHQTQQEIVKLDAAVVNVTDELHVQGYRITTAEKQIDKLEAAKNAN